ncbi:MAG: hypothetical protein OXC62_13330 [Aestuariivita sp.]|nr:hypothetical protein [Aestuariivita sp.]
MKTVPTNATITIRSLNRDRTEPQHERLFALLMVRHWLRTTPARRGRKFRIRWFQCRLQSRHTTRVRGIAQRCLNTIKIRKYPVN